MERVSGRRAGPDWGAKNGAMRGVEGQVDVKVGRGQIISGLGKWWKGIRQMIQIQVTDGGAGVGAVMIGCWGQHKISAYPRCNSSTRLPGIVSHYLPEKDIVTQIYNRRYTNHKATYCSQTDTGRVYTDIRLWYPIRQRIHLSRMAVRYSAWEDKEIFLVDKNILYLDR